MRWVLVMVSSLYLALSTAAQAQVPGPKFVLHVAPHSDNPDSTCLKSPTHPDQGPIPCSEFVTQAELGVAVDVYIVITTDDSAGISGASLGIVYNCKPGEGVDVLNWTECISGLSFPSTSPPWPESGSGNLVTWIIPDDCQNTFIGEDGIHAVVGAFSLYAYNEDRFWITPNFTLERGPELTIATCERQEVQLPLEYPTGWISFGSRFGCNPCVQFCADHSSPPPPCDDTPVAPTTWGRIKGLYGMGQPN